MGSYIFKIPSDKAVTEDLVGVTFLQTTDISITAQIDSFETNKYHTRTSSRFPSKLQLPCSMSFSVQRKPLTV